MKFYHIAALSLLLAGCSTTNSLNLPAEKVEPALQSTQNYRVLENCSDIEKQSQLLKTKEQAAISAQHGTYWQAIGDAFGRLFVPDESYQLNSLSEIRAQQQELAKQAERNQCVKP